MSRFEWWYWVVAGALVLGVGTGSLLAIELHSPGGVLTLSIAHGESMGVAGGDLTVSSSVPEVHEGSIIRYRYDGKIIRHRAIEHTADGWITKGDANELADQYSLLAAPPIEAGQILGVVIWRVPIRTIHEWLIRGVIVLVAVLVLAKIEAIRRVSWGR